uniref:MyTH4 domain-containing protein n=1 Tax=Latimeria chalumnae TaxID=7897 RepID=H3A1B7_LATCH
LVFFPQVLISESLLEHQDPRTNELALEAFQNILAFMGDLPFALGSELDSVHRILEICEEEAHLPDEVYCQILKQLTYTRSPKRDACFKAWQLLYILTACHRCSEQLQPTLELYLKTVGRHRQDAMHDIARACYQQLKRVEKIGARVHYPSIMEIKALKVGHSLQWIFVTIPGGFRLPVKINMATIILDIFQVLCARLSVTKKEEKQDYGIFYGTNLDSLHRLLQPTAYVLDILQDVEAEDSSASLWFCRTHWSYPLRYEKQLCVSMQYHQVLQLYQTGQLLMRKEHSPISQAEQASRLAALKHRATGASHPPNRVEMKDLIPTDIWLMFEERYWMEQVTAGMKELLRSAITPFQAKSQFLEIISSLPMLGSSLLEIAR